MTFCLQYHSCALLSGGTVSCWGDNSDGEVMLVVGFEGAVCLLRLRCMSCCEMTTCFFRAARRWNDDPSIDALGCCWFGQRRCDACFGRGKIGVVIAAWLLFRRHVAAVSGDCIVFIGCVVVIGRFEFCVSWFVVFQEGCVKGSGGCDVLFAVSFLCPVERRHGLVLGKERRRPSDACCCF